MAGDADKATLRRALQQRIPALTAVEIASKEQGQALREELTRELVGRPYASVDLVADSASAVAVFDAARKEVAAWPPDDGVLFIVDQTPGDAPEAAAFWRTLNLQREHWGSLPAHVVFLLRPDNYEMMLRAADHLASWMPLKFDLRPAGEGATAMHSDTISGMTGSEDPRSASLTLKLLEEDLARYLAKPTHDPRVLLRRFYLPAASAARNVGASGLDPTALDRAFDYAERARNIARKERMEEAEAHANVLMGNAYQALSTGNRADNLARAITCYEAALPVYTEADFPREWAGVQNNLGNAYRNLLSVDQAEDGTRAIARYEAALRGFTESNFPKDWAMTQNNLGITYVELPTGDHAENLARAIARFEAALRVYTEADFPREWAMTRNNLGNVYSILPSGVHAEHLERAIACYEAALRVYTEADSPREWSSTQNNLGIAYSKLLAKNRAENLTRAVTCYEAALRVRSEVDSPQSWAKTQNNLGNAYADLPTGDRAENLERAIACYEAALRVRTEADFPRDWAITQNNLGIAYQNLPSGDRAKNLERAIASYEAALSVFTEEAFPHYYAKVGRNLEDARKQLNELGTA
jgi:tetratricopeptide (TPR) repeat protein